MIYEWYLYTFSDVFLRSTTTTFFVSILQIFACVVINYPNIFMRFSLTAGRGNIMNTAGRGNIVKRVDMVFEGSKPPKCSLTSLQVTLDTEVLVVSMD